MHYHLISLAPFCSFLVSFLLYKSLLEDKNFWFCKRFYAICDVNTYPVTDFTVINIFYNHHLSTEIAQFARQNSVI
ncbi:hypothetical protein Peur_023391 [Populus x canadensis]